MKISKENAGYIFIIVLLACAFAVSVYLGMSGWYFHTEQNYSTDLQLGKTVQINLKGNQANALSLNVEGAYLPGQSLPQIVAIKNIDSQKDLYVRAKVSIDGGNNVLSSVNVEQTLNWIYREEDGYYYYNGSLSSQNKATLCSNIYMPNEVLLQTTKKYIVTFVFESLESGQDALSLWNYDFTNI